MEGALGFFFCLGGGGRANTSFVSICLYCSTSYSKMFSIDSFRQLSSKKIPHFLNGWIRPFNYLNNVCFILLLIDITYCANRIGWNNSSISSIRYFILPHFEKQLGKPQKSSFFSGQSTKASSPSPSWLSGKKNCYK